MKPVHAALWPAHLPWPVLLGLAVLWAIFQVANPNFLSALNLTNLLMQIAAMGTISVGLVLVLLLGEIDLSAGALSGLCAGCMAVLHTRQGLPGEISVALALLVGTSLGAVQGWWITRTRVPSFVVTLAGLMAWQGALLLVLGPTGTVNLRDPFILALAGSFLSPTVAWIATGAIVVVVVAARVRHQRQRRAAGLPALSPTVLLVQSLMLAATASVATAVLSADRGFPSGVLTLLVLVVLVDFLVTRTRFGRHVRAVGSNAQAAHRAGIPVQRIRVMTFALASTLAAAGGILAASRLQAVNQSSGSGDLLLNAIAAAVIGGTSLFGGVGTAWSALLGALVIGSISNGMDLLALESSIKFMVTGAVLLLAVTVDAAGRQRRARLGQG